MAGTMTLRVWDVEHGACAMLEHTVNGTRGPLAMIDSGDMPGWKPSTHIRDQLGRTTLDYLFITNADQDHMSDLQGLWDAGISVPVWYRNHTLGPVAFEAIKKQSGPLTRDAKRYLQNLKDMVLPVSKPFNLHMGGITATTFNNSHPVFTDTNNLSLVVFIKFGAFKILFPGDLEVAGWKALLMNPAFRNELADTTILIASHHGRENGYFEGVFDYCKPQAVIMSDKSKVHDTQEMCDTYRRHVIANHPQGVAVANTGKRRRVLTTRRDGHITLAVTEQGYRITTEVQG